MTASLVLACTAWCLFFEADAPAMAQSTPPLQRTDRIGGSANEPGGASPAPILTNTPSDTSGSSHQPPPATAGTASSSPGVKCNRAGQVVRTVAGTDAGPNKDYQDDYPDFAVSRLSSNNGPTQRQNPPSKRSEAAADNEATTRPASEPMAGGALPGIRLTGSPETQLLSIAVKRERELTFNEPIERVAVQSPEVAQIRVLSPTKIVVTGESIGTTQLALDSGGKTLSFLVVVEPNLDLLREVIASIAPTADIQLRSVNSSIVLTGRVPDAGTSELIEQVAKAGAGGELIIHLEVAGVQQTMLRVVIAEVNKEALRELGINWAIGGSTWSRDFFMANNVAQINPTAFSSSGLSNVLAGQQTYSVAAVANGANTNLTFGFPRAEMQWFLNALRQNGLARTLAEPNLVAFSGQTATFLAGGEVPIPVVQSGSVSGAITITYKEFGVRLAFTPTILGGQLIRLHVMSEVSDALPSEDMAGALPLYTFTTRRVESTIECGNSQTFVIAGLLRDNVRATVSKIPGLGDLPVLGSLFSSTSYRNSETEMVVLVTPQLVEPFDSRKVSDVPGGRMKHPSDFELFGLGQLQGTPYPPAEAAESDDSQQEQQSVKPAAKPSHKMDADALPADLRGVRGAWGFEIDHDVE
jgi:pilus assembly protein CpaC